MVMNLTIAVVLALNSDLNSKTLLKRQPVHPTDKLAFFFHLTPNRFQFSDFS